MLHVEGLQKSFGATKALAGVDLAASAGEVHAIVGENGAGKSTLMAVLSGAIAPDAGTMRLGGEAYRPKGPHDARDAGVAMVHQELSVCPHLTVTDNVMLGAEPAFSRPRELRAAARALLDRVLGDAGARIDERARLDELSPADAQLVEIVRAVGQTRARVLILDEPTSSLASDDVARLFAIVKRLRAEGKTVLYVSHFLEEVRALADRVTVLRDGASVRTWRIDEVTNEGIVEAMVGRRVEELFPRRARTAGEVILRVHALSGEKKPRGASLELRRGEVLGIAGLVGAGRTELLRAIFGLDPVRGGEVRVASFAPSAHAGPRARLAQGLGLLSEDRKREGLMLARSIAHNVTLSKLPGFAVWPRWEARETARWMKELAIKAERPEQAVGDLSGGNQQKVALARLLHHDVDVFLLDEPTRGIDVGAKAHIYETIDALAARGKAVLMVSSYLPELLGVCDRIAVMRRGTLGLARETGAWTEKRILEEATGA